MSLQWLIAGIVFVGAFTQSLSGFGVALVTMTLLPGLLGLQVAVPLVALLALTIEVILVGRYWREIRLRPVLEIALASLLGVPVGMMVLRQVDERIALGTLGVIITAYALYALTNVRLPRLSHPTWAALTGIAAGVLGGAFNTSGPPVVIYGQCRGWQPGEFKGNLQGFFIFNSLVVISGHAFSQNLTGIVWQRYVELLPVLALGIAGGLSMDRFLNPLRFRQVMLALLGVLGLRLIFFG